MPLVETTPNVSQRFALQAINAMDTINRTTTSVLTGVNLYGGRSSSHTVVVPTGKGVTRLPTEHATTTMDKKTANGFEKRKIVFRVWTYVKSRRLFLL